MPICQKCGLDDPPSAVMCDCGHPFDEAGAAAARAAGYVPRHQTHPPGPSGAAKFGFGVLGYVIGSFPVMFLAEYRAALGHGDSPGLTGIGVLTGIAGVLFSLRFLRKRHEASSKRRNAG